MMVYVWFTNLYSKYLHAGSILEWNMKKGLVMSTLMQLKKSGTVRALWLSYLITYIIIHDMVSQGDGWISNSAAGLCFDFHPADPR